jgi:hypothetical protein
MRTFERLPGFLRELRPTLQQLGDFSDQMTPVLADLHTAAPDLSRFFTQLGPFSRSATTSVVSLGRATVTGRPALVRSLPLVRQVARLARNALPVGKNLDALTASFDRTGGIERLVDYIFFQVTAVNGFDGISHYLRAGLEANLCSAYALVPAGGCSARYTSETSNGKVATGDPTIDRLRAALLRAQSGGTANSGGTPAKVTPDPFTTLRELTDPGVAAQRRGTLGNARGASGPAPRIYGSGPADQQALDYLLGNDR